MELGLGERFVPVRHGSDQSAQQAEVGAGCFVIDMNHLDARITAVQISECMQVIEEIVGNPAEALTLMFEDEHGAGVDGILGVLLERQEVSALEMVDCLRGPVLVADTSDEEER